ncbi:Mysoin-binding motif of peroxisomes-domain-containing protein [Phycomyces blakesleeanus]|uniref:Inheritance of peroxisomes protein 2 n=1 Tax=Phycomyces blakesleeanus TaxID=4837 RepID=A0ABR3BCY3_PHYBL
MTEFVVYEDSPLAEYLESIESNEKTDTFSVSLPIAEETAFEEKFKYLIVTSPLLNEILSVHTKQHLAAELPFSFSADRPSSHVGTLATIAGLLLAFGTERIVQPRNQIMPVPVTITLSSSVSLFFVYRHMRRSWIRQLYQTALSRLQTLVEECDRLDTRIHRALITIQEIELVSRGYRLSTPLSPISRIEQTSKSRRCMALRQRLAGLLRKAFMVYEEAIMDLSDQVNKTNVSRLYEMYNVRSIASLSAVGSALDRDEEAPLGLDYLKQLAQLMHSKRRECMMQFLALDIMTEAHDSVRGDYENGWHAVNMVLFRLVTETKAFATESKEALDNELCKPTATPETDAPSMPASPVADGRLRQFIHRLSSLDQQIRTFEAKIYLCHDDIRHIRSATDDELKNHLLREYQSLQTDMSNIAIEWQMGRDALQQFLEPSNLATPVHSPVQTPVKEEDEEDIMMMMTPRSLDKDLVTSEDVSDVGHLPLPSKAELFEATADVVEPNTTAERSRKSRQERIADMKLKREEVARVNSTKHDSQTMVHELKTVLDRRVADLDSQDK